MVYRKKNFILGQLENIELFDSVPENFTYDRKDALVDLKMALDILKAWEKH
ncbi:hypothetical protein [Butyrivibrio sp. MB2005]|uniref:hypothetical protein n=1 Tax=Butyrivibrio sp. MB2005 TaxID=1280678 RepID=UPI00040CE112|nr:hypothetical protein [Butyrivibrio sp. MB2005]